MCFKAPGGRKCLFFNFLGARGSPGDLGSLGEAGESKMCDSGRWGGSGEPGGGWGIENRWFSLVFQAFGY